MILSEVFPTQMDSQPVVASMVIVVREPHAGHLLENIKIELAHRIFTHDLKRSTIHVLPAIRPRHIYIYIAESDLNEADMDGGHHFC